MDGSAFDRLVRLASGAASRRGFVQAALVPALAGVGITALGDPTDADAKKKKRKKKCKKAGASCSKNKQCCPGKTKRICDVPTGASNSDTECCGVQGAKCGGVNADEDALPPFCCIGEGGDNAFICSEGDPLNPNTPGTCIPVI